MFLCCSKQFKDVVPSLVRLDPCKSVYKAFHWFHAFHYHPRTRANTNGATMLASDSMMYFGVSTASFPHVIFSFGTAPEYEPYDVVESEIWQKYPHTGMFSR